MTFAESTIELAAIDWLEGTLDDDLQAKPLGSDTRDTLPLRLMQGDVRLKV